MQSNLLIVTLAVLCLLAPASSMNIDVSNLNNIEFNHDVLKVLSGILDVTMEGSIDAENGKVNKLGAFLKFAEYAFPIVETFGVTEKKLEFTEKFTYDWGFVSGEYGFTFEFYIGWHVTNGTAKDYEFLNVTYVPYVRGEGSIFGNAESWSLKGDIHMKSDFVNIQSPISTQFNFKDDIQFCYDANAKIIDPSLNSQFTATVKS